MSDPRIKILLSLTLIFCSPAIVTSAGLSDPLQPPQGHLKRAVVSSGQTDPTVRWVLQSVLLGKQRAVAIIDGVPVSRGERYQGARLLKIEADEVVLQNREGKKIVLKLTPNIHKKTVSTDTEKRLK